MKSTNLRRQILLVFAIGGLIPTLMAAGVLYTWAHSERERLAEGAGKRTNDVRLALVGTLQRHEAISETISQAHEMADFLAASHTTRPYIANALYGRIAALAGNGAEAQSWTIVDPAGKELLTYPERSNADHARVLQAGSGWSVAEHGAVVYAKELRFDDQDLDGPTARVYGHLLVDLDPERLRRHIHGLDTIKFLPPHPTADHTAIEVTTIAGPQTPATMPYFILLAVVLVASTSLGIVMMRRRVLLPLRRLTDSILSKARQQRPAESASEIELLQEAFSAYERTIAKTQEDLVRESQLSAIGRTTQMLAHDVRKPFSILRIGLGMLSGAKDPASVKAVMARLLPEIDKALGSVDGLIADVMEVGSTAVELIQEAVRPETLIADALDEVFRIYPHAEIQLDYDLRHSRPVDVQALKVGRVFSNIMGNALQAMNFKGRLWFQTRDQDGFVEFTVGNTGSMIPPDILPKLFEVFFTSGKKGGTGLGLAIAEKVVKAHGGKIWCESGTTAEHADGYVAFKFTLPMASAPVQGPMVQLPAHSAAITSVALASVPASIAGSISQAELALEAELIAASKDLGRSLRVLVVDDEEVYRQALGVSLSRTPELTNILTVRMATDSHQALELVSRAPFDAVITDIDMGHASADGFELVQALRTRSNHSYIVVHSNRIVADDYRTAMDAGADAFISKPASRAQLLKLMLQATLKAQGKASSRQGAVATAATSAAKPEVLVVDDNIFILEAWEQALSGEAVVHLVASPEELAAKMAEDPAFLTRLACMVTDHHFPDSQHDGLEVGRMVKQRRADLPILLSSDGELGTVDLTNRIDAIIRKEPMSYQVLIQACVDQAAK